MSRSCCRPASAASPGSRSARSGGVGRGGIRRLAAAALVLLGAWAGGRAAVACETALPLRDADAELRRRLPELASPWQPVRAAALAALRAPVDAEPAALVAWLADPQPLVRRVAAELLRAKPDPAAAAALRAAFLREELPGVAEALAVALGRQPRELAAVAEAVSRRNDPRQRDRVDRLLRAVACDALTERMRDGRVPGFYDGQFAALWPLHPRFPEELRRIAIDDGYHIVLRELAVMALHETRRPTLEADLAGLIQPELRELEAMQQEFRARGPNLLEVYEHRKFELSRYVRFALAKAGRTGPILRMIRCMEGHLAESSSRRDIEFRGDRDSGYWYWRAEFLRGLLFETGYYYQQFDDYASAERCYDEVLARFPESYACENSHYNLACICAIQGRRDEALDHLREAIRAGFSDHRWLQEDGDFAPLRADPEFQQLVQQAALGLADDAGRDWIRRLRRHLPAGCESFFALPPEQQEAVYLRARADLSLAQRQRLVDDAPAEQRERLKRLTEAR